MATVYRYEYDILDCEYRGIFVGMDDIFTEEEIFDLVWFFEQDLPGHDDIECMDGTLSYFTSKGNRHFSKAIRKIKQAAKAKGIDVICITEDDSALDIIHRDKYQVISRE